MSDRPVGSKFLTSVYKLQILWMKALETDMQQTHLGKSHADKKRQSLSSTASPG
jgi:hypothetical protein